MNRKLLRAIDQLESTNTELENIKDEKIFEEELDTHIKSLFKHAEGVHQSIQKLTPEIEELETGDVTLDPENMEFDEENPFSSGKRDK